MGKRRKIKQLSAKPGNKSNPNEAVVKAVAKTSNCPTSGPWVELERLSQEEIYSATHSSTQDDTDDENNVKKMKERNASSRQSKSTKRNLRSPSNHLNYNETVEVVCLSDDSENEHKQSKVKQVLQKSPAKVNGIPKPMKLTDGQILDYLNARLSPPLDSGKEEEHSDSHCSDGSRSYTVDKFGGRRALRKLQDRKKYIEPQGSEDEDDAKKSTKRKRNDDGDYSNEEDDGKQSSVENSYEDDDGDEDFVGLYKPYSFSTKKNKGSHERDYFPSDRTLRQRDDVCTYAEMYESDSSLTEDEVETHSKVTERIKKDMILPRIRKEHTHLKIPQTQTLTNKSMCNLCKDKDGKGFLLFCDSCLWLFHSLCLYPPVRKTPKSDKDLVKVKCPRCTVAFIDGDPNTRITSILSWRWTTKKDDSTNSKLTPAQQQCVKNSTREYYVHIRGRSFWDCVFASEFQLRFSQSTMLMWGCYLKKNDMSSPPTFLDEDEEEEFDEDEKKLKEKYYQFGVRPAWLKVHRIINHKRDLDTFKMKYLVKWKDLDYTFCSWEDDRRARKQIPDFAKAVELYHDHRTSRLTNTQLKQEKKEDFVYKHLRIPPTVPVTNLSEKYELQPCFIDECGPLSLHPYQLDGLNWLRHSYAEKTPTILADEMGLGKTIQAITFLYSLYKEGHNRGPFLISAPLSTLVNWEREFATWAPDFYVVTYAGLRDNRVVIRENELSYEEGATRAGIVPSRIRGRVKFNVLLTNFEYISQDAACLASVKWQVLIVDEGHRLRSCDAKFFRFLIGYTARYKLVLTGTPLQNNLEELFHLLSFLCPKKFNDQLAFQNEFTDISQEEQVTKLHELLAPHLLRRLKADVLKDLPSKAEVIVGVELTAMQKKFYKYILTKNFGALNSKVGGYKTSLQNIFMDLRKCCNHPYLFSRGEMEAPKQLTDGELYELNALTKASGKLILLEKMLKALKQRGHRVLIFSQMTRMLDILEDFLEGEGYKYERLDGRISGALRQEAIDRFNAPGAEQFVFLLSTRAGGLGINLATADTVIVYDSDWNPHNDIQAFSRAHRIGQVNKVMIYRLVTRQSIEEKMVEVAKKKMMLTHLVVRPGMGGEKFRYSKQEQEEIVQFGTEKLFDEEETPTESTVAGEQYSDEAIEKLLDSRNGEEGADKETWFNEYLSKFAVVNYIQGTEEDVEEEDVSQVLDESIDTLERPKKAINPVYWQKWLGKEQQREEAKNKKSLEIETSPIKGIRLRKRFKPSINVKETVATTKKKTVTPVINLD